MNFNPNKTLFFNIICILFIFITDSPADLIERKCGTFSKDKSIISKRLFGIENFKDDILLERKDDILPLAVKSPANHFYIHYSISGYDAVENIDNNQNGIPDYIDSVAYYYDFVYNYQINILGLRPPNSDAHLGGNSLYDIYVCELGKGNNAYYGLTYTEFSPDITSYIVIDNNYSPTDSSFNSKGKFEQTYNTFGIEAMKVTAAHEFNHSVQLSYPTYSYNIQFIAEMSSTLLEYWVFPEVKDYKYYIDKFISELPKYSLLSSDPTHGYLWVSLFIKIFETYNDYSFLKNIWENANKYENNYKILNETLKETFNTNLDKELFDMTEWLYHTGNKSNIAPNYKDVNILEPMKFAYSGDYSIPSLMYYNNIFPYSFYPIRVYFPFSLDKDKDTLDFIILNNNKDYLINNELEYDKFSFNIFESLNQNCDRKVLNNEYCLKFEDEENLKIKIFENTGSQIKTNESVFPIPYTGETDFIAFPIPTNYLNDKIHLSIYNIDNNCLYSNIINIGLIENYRVAIWFAIPEDFRNGIYLYKLSNIDQIISTGKFSIEKTK